MMLYVFHVDVGRMMSFDMTVALSSVENLKATIERLHGIPASNIVLLVSGGEMLTQSTQVSYYSAGTDTNPIYMFLTGDDKVPPALSQTESDVDLREQVERCLELPAVYETVVTRAQLALKMFDLAREEERTCERLVHEQHLQQQGWSAVVANIEDLTDEFRHRFINFCAAFDKHLERRSTYLELLRNFGDDLTMLARIPILPGLMPLAEEDFHGFDEFLDTDEVFSRSNSQQESVLLVGRAAGPSDEDTQESVDQEEAATTTADSSDGDKSSTSPNKKLKMGNDPIGGDERIASLQMTQVSNSTSSSRRRSLNLLQWITSKENHNTLKLMSDECIQGLGTFNAEVYEKLKIEVQSIIKLAEQSDVKEIKGLGDRLCKLEEFKFKIKGMVKDQKELSTAFQQNQARANKLGDASILPDLCASHQSQMVVMLANHQKIRDHRRCIAKAKDELGNNLYTRLKSIVWIQNAMNEFDNRLLFYHRCLRRAERHINIIKQIHQAPCIYIAAVTEVVRRKIFSGEFRVWASKLAEDFDAIHIEEIRRRQLFNANFEGHFLNILFPGMSDMPPAFANEHPLVFDVRLPNITRSDIDMLSSQLPDLATQIDLPDMAPVINFFVSRSGAHQRERMEELLKQQVTEALTGDRAAPPLQHQRLGELQKATAAPTTGGCDGDSETDTETEFEQVQAASAKTVATSTSENQQPPPAERTANTMARSTATDRLLTQSAETLTEENTASTRAEVERLRGTLAAMSQLSLDCIRLARAKLDSFRADATTFREDLQTELQMIAEKWYLISMQSEMREEQLQRVGSERDAELQRLREELQLRDSETEAQSQQHADSLATLQSQCDEFQAQLAAVRDQLKAANHERDCAVAHAREELIHEHKTEIESLRCRFKLMTSMERSPSDSSLEKLDRPTAWGGACVDPNVIELEEHEALLAQLRIELDAEREQAIVAAVDAERCIWQSRIFPMNSESVMANVGMLTEMLEEKERQLNQFRERELMLTKENYQLKTRLDALTNEDGNSWLKEKIEYLNRDKNRLQEELTREKSRRQEMESSFAALKHSAYAEGGVLPRSKSSSSSQRYVVLESCSKGDIVFVVWDVRHCQFMIVQDSPSLYFVHGDCLTALDLHLPPVTPAQGEVSGEGLQRIPMPYYAVGRVVDKEYCQAKKDENRYRVPRSSKFYRIKLEPLTSRQVSRRERLESFSTSSISRSISQCESQSEAGVMPGSTISTNTLRPTTHSSSVAVAVPAATSRVAAVVDVVDSGVVSVAAIVPGCKERTISITSVAEEDDEPVSLLSDRCRYISVSEETDLKATADTISQPIQHQEQQQIQSVITEQPTATSSKLKMDLLLASADIVQTGAPHQLPVDADSSVAACSHVHDHQQAPTAAIVIPATGTAAGGTATITCTTFSPAMPAASFGTTSEDSDEYRSLEGRDDVEEDFAISE